MYSSFSASPLGAWTSLPHSIAPRPLSLVIRMISSTERFLKETETKPVLTITPPIVGIFICIIAFLSAKNNNNLLFAKKCCILFYIKESTMTAFITRKEEKCCKIFTRIRCSATERTPPTKWQIRLYLSALILWDSHHTPRLI